MKTIAILREHDVFTDRTPTEDSLYIFSRKAVRMFLLDENDHIAALHYPPRGERVFGEYLLVGGGVEEGETLEEALIREAKEEAGCEVHLIEELGHVKQYGIGKEEKRIQDEYFYRVRVKGEKGETNFDERERGEKVELHWVPLEKLIATLEKQRPSFGRTNSLLIFERYFSGKGE